ncbi:MAG TPA: PilZ domain-containing protein [Terriglobales bacterium]|nr:PilZ domain-containing protein [Terriglobales bacterium]
MTLECLLVVRNPTLLRVLTDHLESAGIHPNVCAAADDALARLQATKFDAVMVDCVEVEDGAEVLRTVRASAPNRRAIVFAIVDGESTPRERAEMGANFVLERPISPDLLGRSLRAARNLMLQERRRYFRLPVSFGVSLLSGNNEIRGTVTNVSSGGLAFQLDRKIEVGWLGQVEFTVTEIKLKMEVKGEVVWLSPELQGGIRFTHIPMRLQKPFFDWLASKSGMDDPDPRKAASQSG